jgi:hypothetical protein
MNALRYDDGFTERGTYFVGQNLDDHLYHIIFWAENLAMAGSPDPLCNGLAALIGKELPEISDGWPIPMCDLCRERFRLNAQALATAD